MKKTTIALSDGRHLSVYTARTLREWRQGLVGRDLAVVDGMFFTFPSDVHLPFHMAGMRTPLLIAFFGSEGQFIDLTYMAVGARPVCPARPYRYVLELVGEHATHIGAFDLLEPLAAGIGHVVSP